MSVAQKCEELQCDATNVKLSDDHILEITFLKNITGRYRNYGNYCVSSTICKNEKQKKNKN